LVTIGTGSRLKKRQKLNNCKKSQETRIETLIYCFLLIDSKKKTMEILVFVTNVADVKAVNRVKPLLTAVPAIKDWNFDLDDCDHILRVVCSGLHPYDVESLLQTAGFDCYELEY
jgi:hypothetical protein